MWQRCVGFGLALVLTACATPTRAPSEQPQWQGRLSVTVQSDPPSASSASFSLQGNARQGELDLYSPLGTTVASLHWTPKAAYLRQGAHADEFGSLDELTEKTTGAALPVQALFGWLHGTPTAVPGWTSDLSQLEQGKLIAKRQSPEPVVILRIQLETAP
jgi:outer membrane lipoprotein LolB